MEVADDFARLAKKFNIPTREGPSIIQRQCWGCREMFNARDPQQRYCTPRCRAKNSKAPGGKQPKNPRRIDYQAYLLTEDWQRKAEAAKKRAGQRCQVCNSDRSKVLQLEAHHRTYENLGHELAGDLTVLCNVCHDLFSKHGRLAQP